MASIRARASKRRASRFSPLYLPVAIPSALYCLSFGLLANSTAYLTTYLIFLFLLGRMSPASSRRTPPRLSPLQPPASWTTPSYQPSPAPPASMQTVWSRLCKAQEAAAALKSSTAKTCIVQAYLSACAHANPRPFPPTEMSISMFFVQHVMRNAGSCRSLGIYSTALRQECALLDQPWLSPGEQIRMDSLVKVLQRDDLHPLQRKLPLQEHHLQRFTALVDRRSLHQLLTLLLLYIAHDGLLRTGEVTSGLLTTDVLWAPDRTALYLRFTRSKTLPRLPDTIPRSPDPQCSIFNARVVGPDGPTPLPDGLSLPEVTISHTL